MRVSIFVVEEAGATAPARVLACLGRREAISGVGRGLEAGKMEPAAPSVSRTMLGLQ
jgi:hypothetical protein